MFYEWEKFLFKTFLDNNKNNNRNSRKISNQSEEEKCQKYDYPNKHRTILCYTT